jgi:hypothetical protein
LACLLHIEGRKEGKKMKKTMIAMTMLAGGLFAAPAVRFGVDIGVRAPVAVVRPVCPGPGYAWMDGYYAPNGVWMAGYWAPPVVRVSPAVRFAPEYRYARHDAPRYEHFRR